MSQVLFHWVLIISNGESIRAYHSLSLSLSKELHHVANTHHYLIRLACSAGGIELKYPHYSVIMNEDRRLAFVSAGNINGRLKKSVPRRE